MTEGRTFLATSAGFVAAAGMTAGFLSGLSHLENSQGLPSYEDALSGYGLTNEQTDAIHTVGSDVSKARDLLQYRSPYDRCNVAVFDIALGGCAPELLPEAGKAIELMDKVEFKLQIAKNESALDAVEAVEESVKSKKAKIEESNFALPVNHDTYSAERLALRDLEEELKLISEETAEKESDAIDDSSADPSLAQGGLMVGYVASVVTALGTGIGSIVTFRDWRKASKKN